MARSTELRQVLKQRFYPFAEERGFVRERSSSPLFALFRRQRDATIQVFDVQWDKYHCPRFVINFGEAPATGVDIGGVHIPGAQIEPSHGTMFGRLQRRRGGSMGCWFQLRKPWLEVLRTGALSYTPVAVADQLIRAFAELEVWWETKEEGPHIDLALWKALHPPPAKESGPAA